MKIGSEELINDLKSRTEKNLEASEKFLLLTNEQVNYRVSPESWSVLECLEHLNLYGRFYLKELNNRMNEVPKLKSDTFKSGMLGNYFANSMLPHASTGSATSSFKAMKTFANMNPIHSSLNKTVIEEFIQQQKEMLRLLDIAKNRNLNKIKCGITISKWIKLKLGDTFRFVIYHNQRHILQAERVLSAIA